MNIFQFLPAYNVRIGRATNSSSSHSIILTGKKMRDQLVGGSYGWDQFIAASPEARLHYLAGQVWSHFSELPAQARLAMLKQYVYDGTQVECPELDSYGDFRHAVDHQSVWSLPQLAGNNSGVTINLEFLADLRDWILSPGVVVLGGNDNGEPPEPPPDAVTLQAFGTDQGPPGYHGNDWVAKRVTGKVWVLFNRSNGSRRTINLTPGGKTEAPEPRPDTPNLVDLKITDKCSIGCKFCYQGSTKAGKHATYYHLVQIGNALQKLGVFEVAIGGGEPTEHPEFCNILGCFKRLGLAVNFTTKSTAWIKDDTKFDEVQRAASAWAYSVGSRAELDSYIETLQQALTKWGDGLSRTEEHGLGGLCYPSYDRHYIHVTMGTVTREEFRKILEGAKQLSITLLGYKQDGRGSKFEKIPYDWLEEELARFKQEHAWQFTQIGVDTPLAQELGEALPRLGVNPNLYRLDEGFDSVYIDGVAGTVHTASYGVGRTNWSSLWTGTDPYLDGSVLANLVQSHFQNQHK